MQNYIVLLYFLHKCNHTITITHSPVTRKQQQQYKITSSSCNPNESFNHIFLASLSIGISTFNTAPQTDENNSFVMNFTFIENTESIYNNNLYKKKKFTTVLHLHLFPFTPQNRECSIYLGIYNQQIIIFRKTFSAEAHTRRRNSVTGSLLTEYE